MIRHLHFWFREKSCVKIHLGGFTGKNPSCWTLPYKGEYRLYATVQFSFYDMTDLLPFHI